MTQSELAGGRSRRSTSARSSAGRRSRTPPSHGLAERLRVDPSLLSSGISSDERTRVEAMLAGAEALSEAHRYAEAIEAFRAARPDVEAIGVPALELRAVSGEAWALQQDGEVRAAIELMQRARALAERPEFSDVDRAEVLFRLGVCRWQLSSISTAIAIFDEALSLAERSGLLRPAARRHPRLALALSSPPARLRRGPRGRGARARAGRGPRRPAGDREHLLPGLPDRAARGPLRPLAQLRAAPRISTSS